MSVVKFFSMLLSFQLDDKIIFSTYYEMYMSGLGLNFNFFTSSCCFVVQRRHIIDRLRFERMYILNGVIDNN